MDLVRSCRNLLYLQYYYVLPTIGASGIYVPTTGTYLQHTHGYLQQIAIKQSRVQKAPRRYIGT